MVNFNVIDKNYSMVLMNKFKAYSGGLYSSWLSSKNGNR